MPSYRPNRPRNWSPESKPIPAVGRKPPYPAGHAFLNDENLLGTYNPDLAKAAWADTVAFLHEYLG